MSAHHDIALIWEEI